MSRQFNDSSIALNVLLRLAEVDAVSAISALAEIDNDLSGNPHYEAFRPGIIINIGSSLNDETLIQAGVDSLSSLLVNSESLSIEWLSALYFNLGNGYFELVSRNHRGEFIPDDPLLQKVKEAYRNAQRASQANHDPHLLVEIYTNYGNALSLCGRHYEALLAYDNALKIDSAHSMAMGNKGIEIERYAFLARNQSGLLLAEAYELVDAAANDATLDDRGLASARSTFAASRDRLKIAYSEWATDLATLRQRIPTERPRTLTEARHHDFATEHGLYLNLCIHDWPCSEKYTDSLFFGYIAPTNDPYVFNRLARYFNQAKEDYAIARYLIVEALHPTPSRQRVSEKTQYADLLEYADYGLNAGLLKTAFIAAYNILDKIAVFLKWELALPEGESLVSFRRIWYPNRRATNLRTEFMRKDDSNLYALYDIAIDLGKEDLHHLNTVRHAITHRHLVVHEWFLMVGEHSDENEHILFDDLVGYGVEILQLIKAALIYLASYLNQEHSRKMKESQGFVAPMPFYWQSDQ